MKIYETELNDELLHKLIDLSAQWEAEGSCYGYRTNSREDIEGNRIFIADDDGVVVGYLLGHEGKSKNAKSIIPDETPYFEIDEIYVLPEKRSQGIGKALFSFVEQDVKASGIGCIMLSTATKNYKSLFHFYIDELGMDFWSARLFKKYK